MISLVIFYIKRTIIVTLALPIQNLLKLLHLLRARVVIGPVYNKVTLVSHKLRIQIVTT